MRTNSLPSTAGRVRPSRKLRFLRPQRAVTLAAALAFAAMQGTAQAATITVTDTGDTIAVDGFVTLREAITSANDDANVNADVVAVGAYGADTINFNIPGGGVKTITPVTGLPVITEVVTIDGYTQPGASPNTLDVGSDATLLIQITGPAGGDPFNPVAGLNITGFQCYVLGLVINGFSGPAIFLNSGIPGSFVYGCWLGTDATGTAAAANEYGVIISASGTNTIGSGRRDDRNLISGNTTAGISSSSSGGTNGIQGNYIGTDKTGTKKIPNGTGIKAHSDNNQIRFANVISGNSSIGISMNGSGNVIEDNFIGVDASGAVALGNGVGVSVFGSNQNPSDNNRIGGPTAASRNVISANFLGISIVEATNTTVQGNFIGTGADGTSALGNTGDGIFVNSGIANQDIGGVAPGDGNLIAFNGGAGVLVRPSTHNIAIRGNSIFSNGQLGIDLTVIVGGALITGVTPNDEDEDDVDTGANYLQNFPVLTELDRGASTITGRLISVGNTKYRIEFFANDAIDPSGHGEGKSFIGFTDVTTNATGNAVFVNASISQIGAAQLVTATATDPDGNTSEFSAAFPVGVPTDRYASEPPPGSRLDFGSLPLPFNRYPYRLVIRNVGNTSLQIQSATFNVAVDQLAIEPSFPREIPADSSLDVILEWSALTPVRLPPDLRLEVQSDDSVTPVASYIVTGTAFRYVTDNIEEALVELLNCEFLANPPPDCENVLNSTPTPTPELRPRAALQAGKRATAGDTQTATFVFDPGESQGLTTGIPSFLGGGSAQLSNFTGSVTLTLRSIPNDPDHKRIRIEGGTMTAPSFQVPSGVQTGLNRLTFGPAGTSDGILKVADGSYTASATATIVNDLFPDGVIVRGTYSGVYNSQTGKLSVQSQTRDFFLATGQLLNISTRMQVLTGDRVLIGGFIITGTDPKKVIIRGIGPSLGGAGVALPDPILELFQGNTKLATNDNWKTRPDGSSQQAEIEATTIPPTNDLESALVATLSPGAYTAILAGKGQASGLGVVEVYDLAQGANAKLANISSRGFVDTGDNIMIGGVIVGGGLSGGDANVIVRAIGPSLSSVGVSGALQDPTLELRNGSGTLLASNDNWKLRSDGSSQQGEIEATTIPPLDDRESALVASLPPGNHTAIVRGVNNTIGIAVVEVYNIP